MAVVENFPKHSPDLNHIEGVWALLKKELADKAPVAIEKRAEFLTRLRRTVTRMNQNGGFANASSGQKERADDVIELSGARTKW